MLHWAIVFFIISLVAFIFGFGEIAAGATSVAKIVFFVCLILFVLSIVTGMLRRKTA